ncbi:MAG TPA: lysylphosphatidylglycerol synthase transmembrane domain-containing protein [Solirubrobacterales bacterium]|nr:lysylphosphatidylglycerol synthase transmembrane domain-containing protein [Solirubrobacterales bacterium]
MEGNGLRPDTDTEDGLTSAERRGVARRATGAILLGAFVVLLLLAIPSLRGVLHAITHMRPAWIAAGVAFEILSCAGFVVVFRLFFPTLDARRARRLAWTEMASGVLLPAGGVGGLAIGGWLMHLIGLSRHRIVERSSALFFITSAPSVVAMVGAAALLAAEALPGPRGFVLTALPIIVGCLATAAVALVPARRPRAARPGGRAWVADLVDGIAVAESELRRPDLRLLGAVAYLAFDIAVLWATFLALGVTPPLAPLVLGYIIGYLANLVPVPGGIGALDGGLVATLVLYGLGATDAAAAVLVYHAIAFWVPGVGGLVGLVWLRRDIAGDNRPSRR